MKPPTIWAVVCTDVDGKRYVFEHCYTRTNAQVAKRIWQKQERARRRYSVVKYVAAKKRSRL